jgi:hypothetical protein
MNACAVGEDDGVEEAITKISNLSDQGNVAPELALTLWASANENDCIVALGHLDFSGLPICHAEPIFTRAFACGHESWILIPRLFTNTLKT